MIVEEGGKRGRLFGTASFIEISRISLHTLSSIFSIYLKRGAKIDVYGLCLTNLESKMENFKNSVKTLNENSQAVQTKAKSLRAF